MYMQRTRIAPGEYYHIFNRGVNKQNVFLERADYLRMLFLILLYQASLPIYNIGRQIKNLEKEESLKALKFDFNNFLKKRCVDLCSFILMPNHFHLLVYEQKGNGISSYLQRIEIAYTKYFNTKYNRSGYLFQGPFQSVRIENNNQLLYLSAYIHRNCREIRDWHNREHLYPWSSYQDMVAKNRWENLLKCEIISKQFSSFLEYRNFVETSGAKTIKPELYIDV